MDTKATFVFLGLKSNYKKRAAVPIVIDERNRRHKWHEEATKQAESMTQVSEEARLQAAGYTTRGQIYLILALKVDRMFFILFYCKTALVK